MLQAPLVLNKHPVVAFCVSRGLHFSTLVALNGIEGHSLPLVLLLDSYGGEQHHITLLRKWVPDQRPLV